jgi:hypothetical protein
MQKIPFYLLLILTLLSCGEANHVFLYEVNEVEIDQAGLDKNNAKSDLEFISLAYADLFGTTITEEALLQMVQAYNSIGDKQLIADYIIRNLINAPGAKVPTNQEMRNEPEAFITDTYKKFFVREPNEYERWYFRQLISQDPDLTPELIYYSFLTSDEYRYY